MPPIRCTTLPPIRCTTLPTIAIALTLISGCSSNTAGLKALKPEKSMSAADVRALMTDQANIASIEITLEQALAGRQLTLSNVTVSLLIRNSEGSLVMIDNNDNFEAGALHFEIPENKKHLIQNIREGSTVKVRCRYYGAEFQTGRVRLWFDVIDISQ